MADKAVILLADDSEDDILLIRRAFQKAKIPVGFQVVHSGEEVLSYLNAEHQSSNHPDHPLPDLLLLDLYMPGVDGFEVLRWLRERPGLQNLRVVVLTASKHIWDVNEAYRLGASSFLVKPTDFEDLVELSKALYDHWLAKPEQTSIAPPPSPPIPLPTGIPAESERPRAA
jgi:CheY-like chemotaxis protein